MPPGLRRERNRTRPRANAKSKAKAKAKAKGRPRTEWYQDEDEQWMSFDNPRLREHILSGHREFDEGCPGCLWARTTQGWKYKGSSTFWYPEWERPLAGDGRGPYEHAGFDPLHGRYLWFVLAIDTGEGFVFGLKDKSDDSYEVAVGELEVEAGLDQRFTLPTIDESDPASIDAAEQAALDAPKFRYRFVLKSDKETAFNVSVRLRARVSRGGGRIHFGIPKQGVPIAEAWVRHGSELIDANIVESCLDERHRVVVGKTTMAKRNFDLGFEHRINKVAHLVVSGALTLVVLSPKHRKLLGIPKDQPRALLGCMVGIDWETTTGVYVEIPVVRRSTSAVDKGLVYRNVMVTSVNFFSCTQLDEKCHGWVRRGFVYRREVTGAAEPDGSDEEEVPWPDSDDEANFLDDGEEDRITGPPVPARMHFPRWTLSAARQYAKFGEDVLPHDAGPGVGPEPEDGGLEPVPANIAATNPVEWCRKPMSEKCPCASDRGNGYRGCLYHRQFDKVQRRAAWRPNADREADGLVPLPPDDGEDEPPDGLDDDDARRYPDYFGDNDSESSDDMYDGDVSRGLVTSILEETEKQLHVYKCVRETYTPHAPAPEELPEPDLPQRPSISEYRAMSALDRSTVIWSPTMTSSVGPRLTHDEIFAGVTQPVTRRQLTKEPYSKHDWAKSYDVECDKVFGTYGVIAYPVTFEEVPENATFAEMLAVYAIKGFDLSFLEQQAKVRIVYGGHWIRGYDGSVIDKRDHPRQDGVTRLGSTSPFEVRVALAWGMIADSTKFPLAKPTLISFDVTAAYLQAPLNDAEYYVTTKDPMLIDAIKRNQGWDWSFSGQPWFKLKKAMYGHPLAGDFWGWEFRSMIELIGYFTHETDEEKTIYMHRGFGPNVDENSPIVAVLVIYVDDGFLVSFDDAVTSKTHQLLNEQWSARDWNLWSQERTERFLAGDHRFIAGQADANGDEVSKVTISMQTYITHGVERYLQDGGKLFPTIPKTPMSTEEEAAAEYDAEQAGLVPPAGADVGAKCEGSSPTGTRAETGGSPPSGVASGLEEVLEPEEVQSFIAELQEEADRWAQSASTEELWRVLGCPPPADGDEVTRALAANRDESLSYAVGADKASRHVGIWSYASMNSVPLISFAVQWLARRTTKWNPECERRLRRLVTYLSGHTDDVLCLVGYRKDKLTLVCEEDADFASDSSRRSTTGYVIKLVGERGSHILLDWKSQLQKSISLSTAEAELVAFRDALKKVIGIIDFVQAFFGTIPIRIGCDSTACLGVVLKGYSKALRHIRKIQDVSTRWIHEQIQKLKIEAVKVSSEDNSSDVLTKALDWLDTAYHSRFGLGVLKESLCSGPFFHRICNGKNCRLFQSEKGTLFDTDPCLCNGGRPRKREFKRDYVYSAHPLVSDSPHLPTSLVFDPVPEFVVDFAAWTGCLSRSY